MKISMLTLGCKVNQYEADEIARILRKRGHEVTTNLEPADCFILSTCAVTNEAERKSRQMIAKLEKLSPNAQIIVCGCASQHDASKFADKPNVTVVVGTAGKNWIPDLLEQKGNYVVDPAFDYEYFEENSEREKVKTKRTRAYVKVQDGCNNFCSYCLIPYIRGRSRSRDLESIVVEVFRLAKAHHEIVLTGINISDWGKDLQMDLGDLLSSLSTINARIRLSSFEMNIITPDLVKIMSNMPNFCDHFHLSMQSACDKTLKAMNRHYTVAEFKKKVDMLRQAFPRCAITTDLIIGFPEETDEDFAETLKNVREIGFADMHLFPYSIRKGTVAGDMQQVDGETVKKRVAEMTALRNQMKQEFLQKEHGMIYEVLFEQNKDGFTVGHARNFTKVYLKQGQVEPNTVAMVRMGQPYLDGVQGDLVKICEDE